MFGYYLFMKWQVEDSGRQCTYDGAESCGHAFKPWSEFYSGNSARGHESWCKQCKGAYRRYQPEDVRQRRMDYQVNYVRTVGREGHKRSKLKYSFGITPEQYKQMLDEQGGVCFLHKGPETRLGLDGEPTRLIPDHDHGCTAGHAADRACPACIRGLICHGCNRMLGSVERSPMLRLRFQDYLERRPLL